MILVTGGSGSGKSAYAEKAAVYLGKERPLYYLATMRVCDREGEARVNRHRNMRAAKGFETIECEEAVGKATELIGHDSVVLLECMSNLDANVMFSSAPPLSADQTAERILADMDKLMERSGHLIIVTNNVFEDGIAYDKTTEAYIEALGQMNLRLAEKADVVVEIVVSIPVFLKGTLPMEGK